MDPPGAPSGAKRALSPLLLSTTTTKRVKHDVPQDELTSLNLELNDTSTSDLWSERIQKASKDPHKMNSLLSKILNSILFSLAETTAKDSFISPLHPKEAERFVAGFNPDRKSVV